MEADLKNLDYAISFDINDNGLSKAAANEDKIDKELKQAASSADKVDVNIKKIASDSRNAAEKSNSLGKNLINAGKSIGKVGKELTTKLTLPIIAAATASFKLASDLNESMNKVDVAFGNSAKQIADWSDGTNKKFGIAKGTALDTAAAYGDMSTSMGLSAKDAAGISETLVGRAGDLASYKNKTLEEVNTGLTGIFTGETESLKQLGVVMTEANLQNFALSKGIKKSYKDMSESEKLMLRYKFVLSRTSNSQGDFERTGGGAAGQMRNFGENLKELGENLGQNLIPIITPMIAKLNEWLKTFSGLDKGSQMMIIKVAGIVALIGPVLIGVSKINKAVGNLSESINNGTGIIKLFHSKIFLVIAAISALVLAFIHAYKTNKEFRDTVNKIVEEFKKFIGFIKNNIIPGIKDFISWIGKTKDKFIDFKDKAIDSVQKKLNSFKKTLKDNEDVIKTVATILAVIFGPALIKVGVKAVIAGAQITANFIKSIITTGKEAVISGAKLTGSFIKSMIETGAKSVVSAAKITASFIKTLIQTGAQAVIAGAKITVSFIGAMAKAAIDGWKSAASLGKGIIAGLRPAFAFIMANPIILVIAGIIAAIVLLHKAWTSNWGGIRDKTKAAIDDIKKFWQGLKDFFAHPIKGVINIAKNVGQSISNIGKNAKGTEYWMGGATLVGENGPELINLPRGSQVKTANETSHILNSSQRSYNNVNRNNSIKIDSKPSFQIIINESKNPKATAAAVEKVLEKKFGKYFDKQMGTIAVQLGFTEI